MGETNNQLQRFFSDNERFADLINTYAGEDILKASDLEEKDSLVIAKPNEKKDKDSISKYRDIIRKAAMGMTFILIGVENQALSQKSDKACYLSRLSILTNAEKAVTMAV